MTSKDYSWRWITGDALISHGPCELVFAHLVVGSANNYAFFYDGESTSGDPIVKLQAQQRTGRQFNPKVPIYCAKGLYVDLSDNVDGVLVQWRELK